MTLSLVVPGLAQLTIASPAQTSYEFNLTISYTEGISSPCLMRAHCLDCVSPTECSDHAQNGTHLFDIIDGNTKLLEYFINGHVF